MHITKDDIVGLFVTIALHTVIILLLLFFTLGLASPAAEGGGGMEIDFGMSVDGSGTNNESVPTGVVNDNPVSENTNAQPVAQATNANQDILKTDAPGLSADSKEPKKNPNPVSQPSQQTKPVQQNQTPVKLEQKQPQVNASALYPGKTQNGGQGNTSKPGNQGRPDGTPGSNGMGGTGNNPFSNGNGNGNGPGSGPGNSAKPGNGPTWEMAGRTPSATPVPQELDNLPEEGDVVVKITIDSYGAVSSATTDGVRGSTTTNKRLQSLAVEYAKKWKWDVKPGSPPQTGYVKFRFRYKN